MLNGACKQSTLVASLDISYYYFRVVSSREGIFNLYSEKRITMTASCQETHYYWDMCLASESYPKAVHHIISVFSDTDSVSDSHLNGFVFLYSIVHIETDHS